MADRRDDAHCVMLLDREEYVEQAYFFRTLRERMQQSMATQELLAAIRHEILSTTSLPYALDYLAGELRLTWTVPSASSLHAETKGCFPLPLELRGSFG